MKKILTLFFLAAIALTAKALTATVYVKAETAPYLYGWATVNGVEKKINGAWPGKQMTLSKTVANKKGETVKLWYQEVTIDASSFNIIFNNGNTSNMKQTGNISNINSDRYFTYDGATKYTDITDDFGVEVPDVEIQSIALISELNEWDGLAQVFTEVEKNKTYTFNLDLTDVTVPEDYYRFKFIVNSSAYLGYDTEGLTLNDPNEWVEQDLSVGGGTNFGIDLDEAGTRTILFTMTFAGGKDIYQGWTLKVEQGTSGISEVLRDVKAQGKASFNLAGQRVSQNYKGIVVTGGKKIAVK